MIIDRRSNSHIVMVLGIVVVALASLGAADAGELLTNPGFEDGVLTPWTTNGTWGIETTNCHSGSYCASNLDDNWIEQTFAGVATSNITSITLWLRQPEAAFALLHLQYSDGSVSATNADPTTPDWTQVDLTSILEPGKTLTGIRVWGYIGGGTAPNVTVLDDVSIQQRETVPALGWQGLLALAALLAVAGAALARQRLA